MTYEATPVYKAAILMYGKSKQQDMAVEEMAELIQALNKHRRGRESVEHIAEEIADVRIMLEQLELMFDCSKEVNFYYIHKNARLAERVNVPYRFIPKSLP